MDSLPLTLRTRPFGLSAFSRLSSAPMAHRAFSLFVLLIGSTSCGWDSDEASPSAGGGSGGAAASAGSGGSGGSSAASGGGSGGKASGGTGGAAGAMTATCMNGDPTELPGRVSVPSPVISRGKPIFASANVTTPNVLVDGLYKYGTPSSFGQPTEAAPEWAAIDLGTGPTRVLLMWSDVGNQFNVVTGGAPAAYRIQTSADSTNGSDGAWTDVATVSNNPYRIREHSFAFTNQRWVRLVVTGTPTMNNVRLDEIEVHDISASGDQRPEDSWFFMGDSITQGGFARGLRDNNFDVLVKADHMAFDPIVIGGGITSELASHGRNHIEDFLEMFPDIQHFAIMYGTNDSWGDKSVASTTYQADMEAIVQAVLDAGRTPLLATIPYATMAHGTLPQFNAVVEQIRDAHGLPCGADMYAWFQAHQDGLDADGIHPNQSGYQQMNRVWADTVSVLYPSQ